MKNFIVKSKKKIVSNLFYVPTVTLALVTRILTLGQVVKALSGAGAWILTVLFLSAGLPDQRTWPDNVPSGSVQSRLSTLHLYETTARFLFFLRVAPRPGIVVCPTFIHARIHTDTHTQVFNVFGLILPLIPSTARHLSEFCCHRHRCKLEAGEDLFETVAHAQNVHKLAHAHAFLLTYDTRWRCPRQTQLCMLGLGIKKVAAVLT